MIGCVFKICLKCDFWKSSQLRSTRTRLKSILSECKKGLSTDFVLKTDQILIYVVLIKTAPNWKALEANVKSNVWLIESCCISF